MEPSKFFNLNVNTPFTHSIAQKIPGFILNYDVTHRPKNGSIYIHITRSALTISTRSLLILIGLVEKAIRFSIDLIKKGIDKTLSQESQEKIVQKFSSACESMKNAASKFYNDNFAPLFTKKIN